MADHLEEFGMAFGILAAVVIFVWFPEFGAAVVGGLLKLVTP